MLERALVVQPLEQDHADRNRQGLQEQPGVAAEEPGHLMSVRVSDSPFGHRTEKKMDIKMLHAVLGVVYSARKHS